MSVFEGAIPDGEPGHVVEIFGHEVRFTELVSRERPRHNAAEFDPEAEDAVAAMIGMTPFTQAAWMADLIADMFERGHDARGILLRSPVPARLYVGQRPYYGTGRSHASTAYLLRNKAGLAIWECMIGATGLELADCMPRRQSHSEAS